MLDVEVIPGHQFPADIPVTIDDLNAAARPTIRIGGLVDGRLIGDEAVQPRHVQPGNYFTATSTGTANALVVPLSPAPSKLTRGLWLSFFANASNTGPATLKVGTLDPKPIRKNKDLPLQGGDIRSGAVYWVEFDGDVWQLSSPVAVPRDAYAEDLSADPNIYKVSIPSMDVGAYSQIVGVPITFLAGKNSTGASTFELNSLGQKNLVKNVGDALATGDIRQGQLVTVRFDGQDFQLALPMTPNLPSVGPGAGTYAYPASISVDAQGRVTGLVPSSAPSPGPKAWATINPSVSTVTKSVTNSSATADTLTITAHGLSDSQMVWLDSGTIGGLSAKTPYYVKVVDADHIKVSLVANLSSIVDILADSATGMLRLWSANPILGAANVRAFLWLATGDYWLVYSTPLADANYAVTLSSRASGGYPWVVDATIVSQRSATAVGVQAWDRKDDVQRELERLDVVVTA